MLSIKKVAEHLNVSVSTIRMLIRTKQLRAVRIGIQYRVTEADLLDYIRRQQTA
jgi:excisionase family DNA binding protein